MDGPAVFLAGERLNYMKKKFWVYVLISEINGSYYVGQTNDLGNRLEKHNQGECSYTKRYRPWKILYQESIDSRSNAFKREQFFKSGAGRKIIKETIALWCNGSTPPFGGVSLGSNPSGAGIKFKEIDKFGWESEEEKLSRSMKISPKKKMEWLQQMHDFLLATATPERKRIFWKLRERR